MVSQPGVTPFPNPDTIEDPGLPPGSGDPLCWYIWRTAVGACYLCTPHDGRRINGADIDWDSPPRHSHCKCWLDIDYCEDPVDPVPPDDPPVIPPEDPPGPGPF